MSGAPAPKHQDRRVVVSPQLQPGDEAVPGDVLKGVRVFAGLSCSPATASAMRIGSTRGHGTAWLLVVVAVKLPLPPQPRSAPQVVILPHVCCGRFSRLARMATLLRRARARPCPTAHRRRVSRCQTSAPAAHGRRHWAVKAGDGLPGRVEPEQIIDASPIAVTTPLAQCSQSAGTARGRSRG